MLALLVQRGDSIFLEKRQRQEKKDNDKKMSRQKVVHCTKIFCCRSVVGRQRLIVVAFFKLSKSKVVVLSLSLFFPKNGCRCLSLWRGITLSLSFFIVVVVVAPTPDPEERAHLASTDNPCIPPRQIICHRLLSADKRGTFLDK